MFLKNGWEVSIELISPKIATDWLRRNVSNRSQRPGTVKRYAITMANGKWMLTPEGICFDVSGRLLNGQHRLAAIVQSGVEVEAVVFRGVNSDVFCAFDRGLNRSHADALSIDRRLAEVARLAASVCLGNSGTVPDFRVAEMADLLGSNHAELTEFCASRVRVFASASFRLAACVRMLVGNPNYVKHIYRGLCLGDTASLPPVAQSLIGAVASGRVVTGGGGFQFDLLSRAWKVFDESKRNASKIVVDRAITGASEIAALIKPAGWA
jgi:hypothetical protein